VSPPKLASCFSCARKVCYYNDHLSSQSFVFLHMSLPPRVAPKVVLLLLMNRFNLRQAAKSQTLSDPIDLTHLLKRHDHSVAFSSAPRPSASKGAISSFSAKVLVFMCLCELLQQASFVMNTDTDAPRLRSLSKPCCLGSALHPTSFCLPH
jgi:hypothetical protein